MMRAANSSLPEEWVLPLSWSKNTPGERCICETMTRSVPLTMKVPFIVMKRHVAHVDVLLLDVLDGLRAGVGIDIEHDEAQRHLERRGEGHAALAALVDVVFRLLERRSFTNSSRESLREVGDREHGLEDGLQALVGTAALGLVDQQELVVGGLLDLDQVRHLRDFADMSEELADTLATGELADV